VIQECARQQEYVNPYIQMPTVGPPLRCQGGAGNQISLMLSMTPSMDGMVESHMLMLEVGQEQMHNMLQTILQRLDGLATGPGEVLGSMQMPAGS
jgi:hypothetical protein